MNEVPNDQESGITETGNESTEPGANAGVSTTIDNVTTEVTNGNHLQAFVELRLLNCDLRGIYQYETKDIPEVKNTTEPEKGIQAAKETRTRIVIMPRDEEPQSMSLKELIDEINKVIASFSDSGKGNDAVKKEDMEDTAKSLGVGILDSTKVQLRQLYLYVDRSVTTPIAEPSKETKKSNLEYAFNFVILNDVKPDDQLKIFGIQKIGLAVYNTANKKIIERMDLQNIDDLLKS